MRSEDIRLTVLRSCGTHVRGLWVTGGALLRSVEEQQRLHFRSTVRRAAPCTMSCCPHLRARSPSSSTHLINPARTLWLCGGVLFLHTAEISNCRSCFACRWDVRRQIHSLVGTTRSPCSRSGPATLALRCWRRCRLRLLRGRVLWGGAADVSRARVSRRTAVSPSPCHGVVTCTRIGCVIIFSERVSANVGSPVGVVPDLRATRPVPPRPRHPGLRL